MQSEHGMGVKYLTTGDPRPGPVPPGKMRLYSMVYCPFAQRPRLVLEAKGLPFETVDVNLIVKPEWLASLHPEAKVPVLEEEGGKLVTESLDICDYLDEKYSEPPLWPTDPEKAARHQRLLQDSDKLCPPFLTFIRTLDAQKVEKTIPDMVAALRPLEEELSVTGTKFFGGDRPGMLDYMLWPFAERAEALQKLHSSVKFPAEDFPKLLAWGVAMKGDPIVQPSFISTDEHANFLKKYAGGVLDYNKL